MQAIQTGANCIYFTIYNVETDFFDLCKNIDVPVFFNTYFINASFPIKNDLITYLSDPIGKIVKTGNWYRSFEYDFKQLNLIIESHPDCLSIDLSIFQNAGATPVQQLSYTLGQLIDYASNIDLTKIRSVNYKVSVSPDFFVEIAKLKALRILHNAFFKAKNVEVSCNLIQFKSKRTIQIFNEKLNKELTLLETEIGILGGVNFFIFTQENDYFKENTSRCDNIFKRVNSSNFCKNKNIHDAIYIETLTQQLIEKSTALIDIIKKGGGFTKQLQKGLIQQKIAEKAKKEQLEFDQKFKLSEPVNDLTSKKYPFYKENSKSTLWKPVKERRLAAPKEKPIWYKLFKYD